VPTAVLVTARAKQQFAALTGKETKQLNTFFDDLANRGCAALTYRLSGQPPLDHVCVKHLRAELRVVVIFQSPYRALIVLVGVHSRDATVDVYGELYRLLGTQPEDDAGRTKPPCCDELDQLPPVLGNLADEILAVASAHRRTRR
jgi:hypothetical protein